MAPCLEKCCCAFPLRRGSLIIGIISLVASILGTLAIVGTLAMWSTIAKNIREAARQGSHDTQIRAEPYIIQTRTYCILSLGVFLGGILVASMLLRGIMQNRPGLMLPYITTATIGVILGIVIDVFCIMDGVHLISSIVHLTLGTGLETHFIVVIYSYYEELRSNSKEIISVPTEDPDTAKP